MPINSRKSLKILISAGLTVAAMGISYSSYLSTPDPVQQVIKSTSSPKAAIEAKRGRSEYFFNMLRDPATNSIPAGIRRRELAFARALPQRMVSGKILGTTNGDAFSWSEVGPNDVGGRTRALAMDVTNSSTVLAGGVSGGVWKSTDGGQTWSLKTAMNVPLSVTWIAQDTRSGQNNTWYYTTGEFSGNSTTDQGNTATFFGAGIYKSTDNGETWLFLSSTLDDDALTFSNQFDFLSKILVDPTNGNLYVTTNGFGILRSTNGGAGFSRILGDAGEQVWSDIAVSSDGKLLATLGENVFNGPSTTPGVYRSTDSGDNWTAITPVAFPATHDRSVLAMAPSDADVAYLLTFDNTKTSGREGIHLFKITSITNGTFSNRTANIPDFGDPVGMMDTQNGYDMVLAVKPDDADFVVIGGTNLFRSTDGFSTTNNNVPQTWIGGYATSNDISQYANQHPDQHVAFFDPNNVSILWSGHDGGISKAIDVTASPMVWESMNNSYNVTQFYHVSIPADAGNTKILGGTQDNGSPQFDWNAPNSGSEDITTGDGAFSYMGAQFVYASSQQGVVSRYSLSGSFLSELTPTGASGQLFIHPWSVDPSDETIMYYPVGEVIRRNTSINSAVNGNGWTALPSVAGPPGTNVTALTVSLANPQHRLYFAASGANSPSIFRLDDSHTATSGAVDISIPGLSNDPQSNGPYVHGIAVNPDNGNEILVIMSNYNIIGLYHSSDGGANYTAVEGNLEGSSDGPSLRSAAILPIGATTNYLVATSVGLFSTTTLNGSSTTWTQEAADKTGNVVVSSLAARTSDNTVAAATHGRGIFIGTALATTQTAGSDNAIMTFTGDDGSQTRLEFTSGAIAGNSVTYTNHGTSLPAVLPGEAPPSIPVLYVSLDSTIPDTTVFEADVQVTYTQAHLDSAGVTDPTSLKLFRYNDGDSTWTQLTTTVDAVAKTATATTNAFSTWALASAIPTAIVESPSTTPPAFSLNQNYPNPFNPTTTIRYSVARTGHVELTIYNLLGQEINRLVEGVLPAGNHTVIWNGRNLAGETVSSGIYIYRLTAGTTQHSRRMTLLK
jgi:photosystem II stability/assembly factor-like uncharacterized protein